MAISYVSMSALAVEKIISLAKAVLVSIQDRLPIIGIDLHTS
jgi:hypothetical protein